MASRLTGQSIDRVEDGRLLVGQGRFVAGLRRPGLLHAAFVRSPHAHARLVRLDVTAARAASGVAAVLTGDDLAAVLTGPMAVPGPAAYERVRFWPLAREVVRFVGDPVALVVADAPARATDAAGLVEVDYEPLPPVVHGEAARHGPTFVWPDLGTNVLHEDHRVHGRPFDEVAAGADRVVHRRFEQHRYAHAPMEGRAAVAEWRGFGDGGELRYDMANKRPHAVKLVLANLLGVPFPDVHVRSGDIGGAFGSKGQTTREDVAVAAAAKVLGRAVRWVEDRTENLQAAGHAREESVEIEAAVAADGRILGLRASVVLDAGAYPTLPFPPTLFALLVATNLPNALRIEAYEVRTAVVASHKAGYISYRAPWVMETVVRERLLDDLAAELGLDPVEIRRRNLITADDQPTRLITGPALEGVTARECLDRAAELSDLPAFRAAQAAARTTGRYLGIGFSSFIENAPGPPDYASSVGFDLASETARARIEPTGDLVIETWQVDHGQGHETTLAQVAADTMGVAISRVRIVRGSSDETPFNMISTGGSRSATMGAGAARAATLGVREQALQIAAHMLEANAADLEIDDGRISVRGTATRAVDLGDVARLAWFAPSSLPPGMAQGIQASGTFRVPDGGWVSACHVCWVEVDVETGAISIPRFLVVEDCGELIHPAIVDGQIRGGVAQGIASVILERHVYDDDGQLLTSTLADYLVPSACELPTIDIDHLHVDTGVVAEVPWRGVGEGGALGAPAAVLNAVADALAPLGVRIAETHLSPQRVRQLVEEAST
jgi:aerobic carbon-monoxide dehydrogenase large subunit